MAARLVKAYEIAGAGGLQMKMRLAMKSGISSDKATSEPDSPENVEKMKKALAELGLSDAI